jgi:hypothetical protein
VPQYGLRAFDLKLSWVHKFRERLTVEPGVSAYNLFNFANFDLPTSSGGLLGGTLSGQPGSLKECPFRHLQVTRARKSLSGVADTR